MGPWELEWDDANVEHLERHGISAEEEEEVLEGRVVRRRGGADAPDRFRVLGRTVSGRYLTLICQQKPKRHCPALYRLGHATARESVVWPPNR